jgi:MFS family permease
VVCPLSMRPKEEGCLDRPLVTRVFQHGLLKLQAYPHTKCDRMIFLRASRLMPATYRSLLAHRRMRPLFVAFGASYLGDGMSVVAVAWLAVTIAPPGQSGQLVGVAMAAYTLPGAVGFLLLSRWLRRLSARRLLFADSTLRAAVLAAVPVSWALGILHPLLYVVLLSMSSLLHAWGTAAKYTVLAEMLPNNQRLAGNSALTSMSSAAMIAGPLLAGLLIPFVGAAWVIGLDALSFAALAAQASRTPGALQRDDFAANRSSDGLEPGGLIRILKAQPQLLGLLLLTWVFNLLYGPVAVALPVHVSEDLHGSASLLGLYWAVFGVGAIIGSLSIGMLHRVSLWPTLLVSVAGWGLMLIPFGLDAPTPITLACFGLGGLLYGPYNPLALALFQASVPRAQLASVLAADSAIGLVAAPLGTAGGGPLTTAFGAGIVLAGSGVATVLLAGIATAIRLVIGRRNKAT